MKRHKQKQRQRNIHTNSVVEFRILKIRILKYGEIIYAPYYESNWNSFDCVEIEEIKVILRLRDFEWNFSNQYRCHYFRNISFEVYIWVVTSYHVISFLSYFFVVYNFILLGLYLNMKFLEEKLLKSALATKSLQLTIFFFWRIFLHCTRET